MKFNGQLTPDQVRVRSRKLDAIISHMLFGHSWAKVPSEHRATWIAFIEYDRCGDGVHVRMLLRRPDITRREPFADSEGASKHLTRLGRRRKGVCLRGDIVVKRIPESAAWILQRY